MTPMDRGPVDPFRDQAVITAVDDRRGFLYVTGRVLRGGDWLTAKFTVYKGDIDHMSRDEFRAYATMRLPDFVEGVDWMDQVLV